MPDEWVVCLLNVDDCAEKCVQRKLSVCATTNSPEEEAKEWEAFAKVLECDEVINFWDA